MRLNLLLVSAGFLMLAAAGCESTAERPVTSPPANNGTTTAINNTPPANNTSAAPANPKRIYQLADFERSTVKVNGREIPVWVADNNSKRQEGLMWVTDAEMKDEEGMLFVFNESKRLSFWMENTVLPLDIIYVDSQKKVVNVGKGKPFDETSVPATGDSQYVLELKQGMADKFGIKTGTQLDFPDIKAQD